MVIGLTDRQWYSLVGATGTGEAMDALAARLGADLSQEGQRWRHRAEITAILRPWFAARRVGDFAGPSTPPGSPGRNSAALPAPWRRTPTSPPTTR